MTLVDGPMDPADLTAPRSPVRRSASRGGVLRALNVVPVVIMLLAACATSLPATPPEPPPFPTLPQGVEDQRGRFREIFCAVLEERGEALPDYRPCDEALTQAGVEPGATGRSVDLGQAHRRLVAAFVPGIGWECFSAWLDSKATAAAHLRQFGYDIVPIGVDALSSSTTNAREIRDAIMAMEPETSEPSLVLIGYSKGTPDILEAIVTYPEIRSRIAAVVGVAGAVGGSTVAEEVTQTELDLLKHWPGATCSTGDGDAVESLRPATRKAWLADNPLPRDLPYYSLVTYPDPEHISSALKPSYKKLSRVDPRNDGMVFLEDQFIPGSTLIGCLNADHWAVAVAIARSHPVVGSTIVTHSDYPREALAEAVLRFVEEDLSTRGR
jgi:hypothetical protein